MSQQLPSPRYATRVPRFSLIKKSSSRPIRIAAEIAFRSSAVSLAILALFGFNLQALAATDTWVGIDTVGSPTSDWINADNWAANTTPVSGDSLVFTGSNAQTSGTLTDSLTNSTFVINGITFSAFSPAYTFTGNAFGLGGAITNNGFNTETINNAMTLQATETLQTDASGGNLVLNGVIDDAGGVRGITILGPGSVTLSGSASNTYTGATTVNAGTLVLNFANLPSATNLISPSSALTLGGGTLQILGASGGSSQSFASTTFQNGQSVLSATSAGTPVTVNLGTITGGIGKMVEFVGPAYNNGASSGTTLGGNTVAATAVLNATSNTTTAGLITFNTAGGPVPYATVGLYDYAAMASGTAGTAVTSNIVGGSQVSGFYNVTSAFPTNTFGSNIDLTGSSTLGGNANSLSSSDNLIRVNLAAPIIITTGRAIGDNSVGSIMVTPNVGANNTILNGTVGWQASRNSAGLAGTAIWQNDIAGEFQITAPYTDSKVAGSSFVLGGIGTTVLAASNSYTGPTFIDGGYTVIAANAAIGAVGTGAAVNLAGGTLVGNGSFSLDNSGANIRPIALGGAGGGLAATNGNTMTVRGVISGAAGTGPLVIGIPASSANNNTAGLLPGTGAGTANTTGTNATGTVALTGANSYTGGTNLDTGTLQINGINALGAANYGGLTFNGGTLQYATAFNGNGSGDLTSIGTAGITLSAAGGTIDLNGNAVTYAGSIGNSGSGSLTIVSSDASHAGSLTLNGNNTFTGGVTLNTGSLVIGGHNVYTGATSINGGSLTLASGGSLGNTAVSLASGFTLLAKIGNGGIGGSVNLANNSHLSLVDSSIGALTIGGTLGITGAMDNLDLDLLGGTGADQVTINGGALVGSGNIKFNLNNLAGGTAPATNTTYTLLSDASGFGSVTFSLGTTGIAIGSNSYTLSLNDTGTQEQVVLTLASLDYYWTGAASSSWSNISGNFATDHTGATPQSGNLTSTSNIFLTADSASNFVQTLDGAYTINSLSFTGTGAGAASNPITLNAGTGGSLTLAATNAFQDAGGNTYSGVGLVVQPGSAAHTINTNLNLGQGAGTSQVWEINNSASNPLTVNGRISDGTTADGLTINGTGELILTATNSYDGGTTLAGNVTLKSGITNALNPSGALTVTGTSIFDLAGFNQTIGGLSDGGVSTGKITTSAGSSILTINNAASASYGGTITDNNGVNGASLSLVLGGSSTVTLSGSNHYSGLTTLLSGNLIAASNFALGDPNSANGGLLMNPSSGTLTAQFTSSNPAIASLASTGAGTSSLVLGNGSGIGSPTTLTIGAGGNSTIFGGVISDQKSQAAGAIGGLNIVGGSLSLNNANTFNGGTLLAGGNLVLGNSLALQNSTLTLNSGGGTLNFGSLLAATFGGLAGTGSIPLVNAASGAVALTFGGNGSTNTYGGSLSGAGSVTIAAGTETLTGSNSYTGATVISAGTVTLSGGGSIGTPATASGAITVNGGVVNITGGFINAPSITTNNANTVNVSGNSIITVSGAISVDANNPNNNDLFAITSGTVSAGSVTMARSATIFTTPQLAGSTLVGVYVNGGTLNVSTTLNVGTAAGGDNSTVNMRVDAGVVTVGGVTTITNDAGGRFSILDLNGGTFTDGDTSGVGILLGGNADTGLDAELLVRGTAIANTPAITLGNGSDTGGLFYFEAIGGTTNIGSGGIVSSLPPSIGAVSILLGSSTVATVPVLTSTASWSSSLPMTLANDSANAAPIFATSAGTSISLSGALSTSGTGGITISGSGTVFLSGANTYNGVTTLASGTLSAQSASALGSTTAVTFTGGTLQYSSNNTVDFSNLIANSSSAISIDTAGQAITYATAFAGSNTGGLKVIDSTGGGSLTLTQPNTYTAPTTIGTNGKLILASGANLGDTPITVAQGGAFALQPGSGNLQIGSAAATLTLNGGASFSMADGAIGTVTIDAAGGNVSPVLNLNGTTTTPDSLTFDLGAAGADLLVVNNGIITFAANGQSNIFIDSLLGAAPATLTGIPILNVPNGLLNLADFVLQTPNVSLGGAVYGATLALNGNSELVLNLTQGGTTNAYFTGSQSSTWSNIANFATDQTGSVAQTGSINSVTNIFLTANNANAGNSASETLDGDYSINSLSFTGNATSPITLASGTADVLTLVAANGFTDSSGTAYSGGTGLVVQPGSGAHTISANIDLGSSQTWFVNNSPANPLTVTGTIADAIGAPLDSLTKTGTGTLILNNTETYDGGTTVSQGTLMLGPSGSLISTGTLTVTGTGTFDLGANSQTMARVSSGGVSTGTITASTGPAVLTINNSTANNLRQTITDASATNSSASLALVLAGSSTITISNSNSFIGGTTLVSGSLTLSSDYALGNPTSTSANAGLNFNNSTSVSAFFTSAAPQVASLNDSTAPTQGADNIVLGNTTGSGSSTTLFVGAGGSASTSNGGIFNGVISDLTSINTNAIGNLVVDGGGFITLGGANTFHGTTVISGSSNGFQSELALGNPLALQDSTLNYNNQGGFLSFGSLTAATFAGLAGSQDLALANASLTGVTLTIGNNNISTTYTGNLSGAGGIIKLGTGTFQVGSGITGGATYTGATLVNQGTLIIGGTSNLLGTVAPTGGNGVSTLVIQDDAIVNSSSPFIVNGGNGNNTPNSANMTISGTASVIVSGFAFSNGAARVANGDFLTIQNSGSLIDNGSFNFINTVVGTSAQTGVTVNLNSGLLATQNFLLSQFGNNAASAATFNLNGGVLEALANDPSGSNFLPALARLTTNVGAGGAIVNTNGFNITIAQALLSGTTPDGGLIKNGAGVLTLAGTNTYNGATVINGGELSLSNSNAITNSAAITFGGGALQYSVANTKDYSTKFLNSLSAVTVDLNGQNVTFASPIGASNTGGLSLEDAVANVGSLTLTTANAYSGQTAINSGATLILGSGGSLPNPNVVINGTLIGQAGNGGINSGTGTFDLNGGGTLSLVDGQIGTLAINGGVLIGNASAAGILDFEINTTTATADLLTITGGVTFGSKGGVINLTDLDFSVSPTSGTQLTLISDASGLGTRTFTLGQASILINGQNYGLSLANSTTTAEIVTLTSIAANYYWTGATSTSLKTISNFAQNPNGSPAWTGTLGGSSNVFLTANSVTRLPATLDGNFTINSLSFTGTGTAASSNPITLANGTGTALTILATSAFGDQNSNSYTAGTGLVVQPGSAAHTISANINLGNSQTWLVNNSSANPLTVTGVIGDGSTKDSLTKSGSGTMILNTAETYDGGTIVNNGTLALGTANALLTTGTLTVTGNGTVDLAGNSQTLAGLADGGVSTGAITTTTGTATLTLSNPTNVTFAGAINDNNSVNGSTLALVLNGPGNTTLSGSSTYSGGTSLNGGNLTVAANNALGNPNATGLNTGLVMNPALSGTVNASFTSSNPNIAALNNPGAGTSNVILGGTAGGGTSTTLNIGPGNGGSSVFTGTISDVSATAAGGVGSLNVYGGATLTLAGTNTYTGTTTITGVTTQLILTNSTAIENSVYNTNGGGILNLGALNTLTLGGLSGNTGFALTNAGSPLALTIGNGNVSATFNGNLSDAGSITKTGTGTQVLNDATYTGGTVVQNGGLTFSGSTNLTTHLDIAAQQGVASVTITGAGTTVTSTGGLYITSPTGGTGTIFGQHANLTVINGAQVIALPDASGRAISYGSTAANGRPAGSGTFTIGSAGDTTTLVQAQGALDLFHTIGGTTVGSLTVNLNGGTLAVNNILKSIGGTTQTAVFNFNGGVLQALASDPSGSTFLPLLTGLTANVQSGGAIINTNGFNITVAQPLVSGSASNGGLTVNGSGVLTLTGANTYTGSTVVNGGRLVVSGSAGAGINTTQSVTVNSGGTLEDNSFVNIATTTTITGGGRLSGTGSIGAVAVQANGTLAPGFSNTSTTAGTLTAHGNVQLFTGAVFSIRLGVATQLDADQLTLTGGGNAQLHNATLTLLNGTAFVPQNEPSNLVYVLINGGAGSTGTGINVFGNAPASGDPITDTLGDTFDVFYGVNASNTGIGNDVVIELVAAAIPEPGTWAEILAGAGILCVVGRARRRSLRTAAMRGGSNGQS